MSWAAAGGSGTHSALRRLLATVRERWLLVALVTLITIGAAVLWGQMRTPAYQAEAILEVTPVANGEDALTGISVIRTSSDPARDIQTLARFVTSPPIRDRVDAQFEQSGAPAASTVTVLPIAQSFLLSVVATADDPQIAADTATAYARTTVARRDGMFNAQVEEALDRLAASAAATPGDTALQSSLAERRTRLETFAGAGDPSVRIASLAEVPSSPVGPGTAAVIAAATLLGLLLGAVLAALLGSIVARLRTEGQLNDLHPSPVLARIPLIDGDHGAGDPVAVASYRDLRHALTGRGRRRSGARSILVASAGPGEGATTTALGLARALAETGGRTLLVDVGFGRPAAWSDLWLGRSAGTAAVLGGQVNLADAVVSPPGGIDALPIDNRDPRGPSLLTLRNVDSLLGAAGSAWDYVVIDSGAPADAGETPPVAALVDDVVVVARRGRTRLSGLGRFLDSLERYSAPVAGFALVNAPRIASAAPSARAQISAPAPPEPEPAGASGTIGDGR